MNRGRTIVVRKKDKPWVEKWLEKNCQASTGPYPSISGMRKLYWGMDALIVRCGAYIYYFGKDTDKSKYPFPF